MIPHLEPIESPCFPLGVDFSDLQLWNQTFCPGTALLRYTCCYSFPILLHLASCLGEETCYPIIKRRQKAQTNLLELSFQRWLRSNLTISSEWLVWKELLHKQQQEQNNWGQCSKEKMEKHSYSSPSNSRDATACLFINKGLTRWVVKHLWKSLKGLSITMVGEY